jgi:hypothetical protein
VDTNLAALFAGVATSVGVYAHGVVGHRWFMAQLRSVEMQPTGVSMRLFGHRDVSREVFGVTWHCVTVVFAASAAALYLTAFGALESRDLLRFIAIIHAAFLGVGLVYTGNLIGALRGPIFPTFVTAMVAAASLSWIASNSVSAG